LKQVSVLGNFPDTVASFTTPDAAISVVSDLSTLVEGSIRKRFERAAAGGTIIVGNVSEEDARLLNGLKVLPHELIAFRSSGSHFGSFHYALGGPEFKDLPSNCVLDQTYADVMPYWSIEAMPNATVGAGSINMVPEGGKNRLRWGADLLSMPLGKGKAIFCQFDIFGKLGKNALADALFANLIAAAAK
jgi:hypothetical protein